MTFLRLDPTSKRVVIPFDGRPRSNQSHGAEALMDCLTSVMVAHSKSLSGHIARVGRMASTLAVAVGIEAERARMIGRAATLHDIGKIGVPDAILNKAGPLDAAEWVLMRRHPEIGHNTLRAARQPLTDLAAEIALGHHECFDGSGYPHGIAGASIPIAARIVSLCDVYDALRETRSYRAGYDHATAVSIVLKGDGRTMPGKFDPLILAAFAQAQHALDRIVEDDNAGTLVTELPETWFEARDPYLAAVS